MRPPLWALTSTLLYTAGSGLGERNRLKSKKNAHYGGRFVALSNQLSRAKSLEEGDNGAGIARFEADAIH